MARPGATEKEEALFWVALGSIKPGRGQRVGTQQVRVALSVPTPHLEQKEPWQKESSDTKHVGPSPLLASRGMFDLVEVSAHHLGFRPDGCQVSENQRIWLSQVGLIL